MRLIKSNYLDAWFIWIKRGKNFRWISYEFSTPIENPIIESYSYGRRIVFGPFAMGTGVVSRETMDIMQNIL